MGSNSSEKVLYMFKRSYKSSIRLNYQHYLTIANLGYHIHPKIKLDRDNARIADIATGTGIWPVEVAATLGPSAKVDGFDISTDQFPPKAWSPSIVDLMAYDTFEPMPEEFHGRYDLVQIRYFFTLLNDEKAERVLQNLVSLLKPGGYLQWIECDLTKMQVKAVDPSVPRSAFTKVQDIWASPRADVSYGWMKTLPLSFEKFGLNLVAHYHETQKEIYRQPWTQCCIMGWEDFITSSGVTGREQADERIIHDLQEESAKGVYVDAPYLVIVGKKIH